MDMTNKYRIDNGHRIWSSKVGQVCNWWPHPTARLIVRYAVHPLLQHVSNVLSGMFCRRVGNVWRVRPDASIVWVSSYAPHAEAVTPLLPNYDKWDVCHARWDAKTVTSCKWRQGRRLSWPAAPLVSRAITSTIRPTPPSKHAHPASPPASPAKTLNHVSNVFLDSATIRLLINAILVGITASHAHLLPDATPAWVDSTQFLSIILTNVLHVFLTVSDVLIHTHVPPVWKDTILTM